mmetsp:Transcript_18125/g.42070  ORF Transcript_18125/g.42070 Transcript_18125/m.42070 type:complete len:217 (+) Transcript_18125:290-940(+)
MEPCAPGSPVGPGGPGGPIPLWSVSCIMSPDTVTCGAGPTTPESFSSASNLLLSKPAPGAVSLGPLPHTPAAFHSVLLAFAGSATKAFKSSTFVPRGHGCERGASKAMAHKLSCPAVRVCRLVMMAFSLPPIRTTSETEKPCSDLTSNCVAPRVTSSTVRVVASYGEARCDHADFSSSCSCSSSSNSSSSSISTGYISSAKVGSQEESSSSIRPSS